MRRILRAVLFSRLLFFVFRFRFFGSPAFCLFGAGRQFIGFFPRFFPRPSASAQPASLFRFFNHPAAFQFFSLGLFT
jgi:hypothetical protein